MRRLGAILSFAAAFAVGSNALAEEIEIELTPLHTALFEMQRAILRQDDDGWAQSKTELTDILAQVDPALCAEVEGWTTCSASVPISFTGLGPPVLALHYWGFAEAPDGRRCILDAIVPPDQSMKFDYVYSELELYQPDTPARIDQHLWTAAAQVAEQLAEPRTMIEQCKELG